MCGEAPLEALLSRHEFSRELINIVVIRREVSGVVSDSVLKVLSNVQQLVYEHDAAAAAAACGACTVRMRDVVMCLDTIKSTLRYDAHTARNVRPYVLPCRVTQTRRHRPSPARRRPPGHDDESLA